MTEARGDLFRRAVFDANVAMRQGDAAHGGKGKGKGKGKGGKGKGGGIAAGDGGDGGAGRGGSGGSCSEQLPCSQLPVHHAAGQLQPLPSAPGPEWNGAAPESETEPPGGKGAKKSRSRVQGPKTNK